MFDFDFYNPTRIVFGKDRLKGLNNLIPQNAKVLITFGGGSARKNGLLDKIYASLGTASFRDSGASSKTLISGS